MTRTRSLSGIAPVLYAFTQAREDLARYSEGLTAEQLWTSMVGFHIRHIARSTERLVGYLEGRLPQQLGDGDSGATREELLAELDSAFDRAEKVVRSIDPATLRDAREVGRRRPDDGHRAADAHRGAYAKTCGTGHYCGESNWRPGHFVSAGTFARLISSELTRRRKTQMVPPTVGVGGQVSSIPLVRSGGGFRRLRS